MHVGCRVRVGVRPGVGIGKKLYVKSLCRFLFRTWNPAHYMNIDNVVALLFFLDFFPNVGFGVAPTRPLVSESFQRPPRDTGEDVHVRVLEAVRSRTPVYIRFVSVSTC